MAALTCIYSDPKKPGDGPRLYLSVSGWTEDPQKAVEYFSLSSANRTHQVPIGYQPSQPVLAEVIKVHPAIHEARALEAELRVLFPQATVTVEAPKQVNLSWFFTVVLPPEKRSFVIEQRYHRGHTISVIGRENWKEPFSQKGELLLRAITLSEPIACACHCHGPLLGFFHCFGGECCLEPDVPSSNAIKAERDAQV